MSDLPALRLPRKRKRSVFQVVGSVCFVIAGVVLLIMGLTSQPFDFDALKLTPAAIHAAATNIIPPETESLTFLFLKKKKKTVATAKTKAVGIKKDGIK